MSKHGNSPVDKPLAPEHRAHFYRLDCRQTGNCQWCAAENCPKTNLTPSALFHQTNLMLTSLDLQSRILVVPLVSHISECSTIRTGFAYQGETTMAQRHQRGWLKKEK